MSNRKGINPKRTRSEMSSDPSLVGSRIYVGQLQKNVTESELQKHFSKFGQVVGVNRPTGQNYAFVQFALEAEARTCLMIGDNMKLNGSKIVVKPAKGPSKAGIGNVNRNRNQNQGQNIHMGGPNFVSMGDGTSLMGPFPGAQDLDITNDDQNSVPNDVEIVVPFQEQRAYAEMVERELLKLNLKVDMLFPPPGMPTLTLLNDLKERKTKFAIVITLENQQHQSVTLYVLHGSPEEHRNMPYMDAIFYIQRTLAKNYGMQGAFPGGGMRPQQNFMGPSGMPQNNLFELVVDILESCALTLSDLNKLIKYLGERQSNLIQQIEQNQGSTFGAGFIGNQHNASFGGAMQDSFSPHGVIGDNYGSPDGMAGMPYNAGMDGTMGSLEGKGSALGPDLQAKIMNLMRNKQTNVDSTGQQNKRTRFS